MWIMWFDMKSLVTLDGHKPTHKILSVVRYVGLVKCPKEILIPRICDRVALCGTRDFAGAIRVINLK